MTTNLVKTKTIKCVVTGKHILNNFAELHIDRVWEDTIKLRFASEGHAWAMGKEDIHELVSVLQEIADAMDWQRI